MGADWLLRVRHIGPDTGVAGLHLSSTSETMVQEMRRPMAASVTTGGKIMTARTWAISVSQIAIAVALVTPASAQTTTAGDAVSTQNTVAPDQQVIEAAPAAPAEGEAVVVTGFRSSIASAISAKKRETAAIDTIVAEDIGKFPDSNLAESMQRVPGVALSRGDGGEGRQIAVRGLSGQFTRVRINGMEGTSQTGSSDIYGAGNSGRTFDFNVFPTEIFQSLTVRKTPSADVEEGSLGATVDLRAPRPFDLRKQFALAATARAVYNEISKKVDPRLSLLMATTNSDRTFGVLASFAFQKRNIREVGYSAVDILQSSANGRAQTLLGAPNGSTITFPFCTPVGGFTYDGFTYNSPTTGFRQTANNPATDIGATAANCSTNNPRTSDPAAFAEIFNRGLTVTTNPTTGARTVVGGTEAFIPRIPRYVNSEQDTERYGTTLSFQWAPTDATEISLDGLYSRYDVERRDAYIANISFARSITDLGQPNVSVREAEFDDKGSLVYGVFDGVDVRSENLEDHFISSFGQVNLNFRHRFSDMFQVDGLVGVNRSLWEGPKRLQTFIDAIDTDNFIIDNRDGRSTPDITFGFDVSNPANFSYAPARPDRTVLGGFSLQGKPSEAKTINKTFELNTTFSPFEGIALRAGAQYRVSDFNSFNSNFVNSRLFEIQNQVSPRPLPAGVTLADITRQISGLDDLFGRGAPESWVAIDTEKWEDVFNFEKLATCGVECGGGTAGIKEKIKSAYIMGTFDFRDGLPIPVRGDVGVRYVKTNQDALGYIAIGVPAAENYPFANRGLRSDVTRSYADWLPSANVVLEFTPDLLGRFSAAKVMSRPELGQLTPSSGVTATTRTGNVNNPFLDPIRARTFDAALEWYFQPGSLLSIAYFRKNIKTYIQRITSQVPYRELGLPDSLLDGTNTAPTEIFTVGRFQNTKGGPLSGFEVNLQAPFRFLPGILNNFGVLANYTRVKSKIDYCLASTAGNCTASTTDDLIDLSKNTASGTLFYEDGRFSARVTASYRDRYIRAIPASPGSDVRANQPNTFVDASTSYNLNDRVKLILEAQNLTDERNTLYIDSNRQDTLFETRIGRTISFGVNYRM